MFKFLNQVYKEIIKEFFGEVDKIVVLGNFYFKLKYFDFYFINKFMYISI